MKLRLRILALITPAEMETHGTDSTHCYCTIYFFSRCIVIDFLDHGIWFLSDDYDPGVLRMGFMAYYDCAYWLPTARFRSDALSSRSQQRRRDWGKGDVAVEDNRDGAVEAPSKRMADLPQGSYQEINGCYDMGWEVALFFISLRAFRCFSRARHEWDA